MPRIPETKPFYLTSEFWATVGLILASAAGAVPGGHRVTGLVIAASTVAYTLSRGLAKSGVRPLPADLQGDPDDTGGAEEPS